MRGRSPKEGRMKLRIGLVALFVLAMTGVAWGETQTHTYTVPGVYDACVTATDQYGASATKCTQVTVRGNLPPVVALVADPATGVAPLPVTFTSTVSDPENDTFTQTWDYGD